MSLEIIHLGPDEVDGGQVDDPERVVKMVGNRAHHLGSDGLRPDRFPEIDSWEGGKSQRELAVANFPGEEFSGLAKVHLRLEAELKEEWQLGGFPELMSQTIWDSCQMLWGRGIWYVVALAAGAVWLNSYGHLRAPCVFCDPADRGLYARWVEGGFDDGDGFLLSRKAGGLGS